MKIACFHDFTRKIQFLPILYMKFQIKKLDMYNTCKSKTLLFPLLLRRTDICALVATINFTLIFILEQGLLQIDIQRLMFLKGYSK